MLDGIATVKLQIQGMEQSIIEALNARSEEMKLEIESAVRKAVRDFDFEQEVKQMTNSILRRELQVEIEKRIKEHLQKKITDALIFGLR